MPQKVIILGSQGMLGQELELVFRGSPGYEVVAWDADDLDATDFPLLEGRLKEVQPAVVINAIAYNAVDLCEESDQEYGRALLLNRDLPAFLAEKSAELDFLLVHYSTDSVFDGAIEDSVPAAACESENCCGGKCRGASAGYAEDALPNPISRYGESKYLGERAVTEKARRFYLIRLSRLFGKPARSASGKKSFFGLMLAAAREKKSVQAVDGEKGSFTYAKDLARETRSLIESGDAFGIYHLVNAGQATWYDAVRVLYREVGIDTGIEAVPAEAFPRPAKRPAFSALRNTKRPPLRPYEEALAEFLSETGAINE